MFWLVLGLFLLLGVHSVRMLAPWVREAGVAVLGPVRWRAAYSLVSVVGLAMILLGYGPAREADTTILWTPPPVLRHGVGLMTLLAFILFVSAKGPRNHFRAWLGHPMLVGTALWALAHVLVNGFLHATVLFGGFLLWSLICLRASWKREPPRREGGHWGGTVGAILIGAALWAGFVFWAHVRWIGVAPFGVSW
ncbi:MAG TPA: NnrU family protein [Arenimonas sp.]|jgi:uncharacterized membrane protein|nr:NnrU family protein [Arenimonas sp.]